MYKGLRKKARNAIQPAPQTCSKNDSNVSAEHDLPQSDPSPNWPIGPTRGGIRLIIEVADGDLGLSKNACIGHAFCREGKPEGAGFVILLHEMNAVGPKRGIFCWLALDANERKILGIDPDAALEQVFILALRAEPG